MALDAELASINARLGQAAPAPVLSFVTLPAWDPRSATAKTLHALQEADSDMDRELEKIEEQLKDLRYSRAQHIGKGKQVGLSTQPTPQPKGEQRDKVGVGARQPREMSSPPAGPHHKIDLQRPAAHTAPAPLPAQREPTYEEFALGKGRKGGGPFWYLREGSQDDVDADPSDVFQIRSEIWT